MDGVATGLDLVVVSAAEGSDRRREARELAHRLGAPCVADASADQAELRLIVGDERIELCDAKMKPGRGVFVDFSRLDIRPGSSGLSRKQPIARAMGRETRTVIDATAGLGEDAFLLACMGFDVTAIERSPLVAVLLEDGLRRALADENLAKAMRGRLRIIHGDALHALESMARFGAARGAERADVVYMDPMFPAKRKASALPKKEMQLLRLVVGDDPDAATLLEAARRAAGSRVVVKRPIHAPPLADNPVGRHEGKLARFDVYTARR